MVTSTTKGWDPMDSDDRRISPTEAARLLGVSRPYVYDLIELGVLPAHKVPRWTGRAVTRLWFSDVEDLRKHREAQASDDDKRD